VEGYRVLESGDLRTLENGDLRVTEHFFEGSVSLSSSSTLASTANAKVHPYADLASLGSVLLVGEARVFGRLELAGVGSSVVNGDLVAKGASVQSATGSLASSGVRVQHGAVSLSGASSVASKAGFKFVGVLSASAEGTTTVLPKFTAQGLFGDLGEVVRVLESGETRVTEDDNIRIVVNYQPNIAYGSSQYRPTVTLFASQAYAKYQNNWLRAVPYVKYEQEWLIPSRMYKHANGDWKRIH